MSEIWFTSDTHFGHVRIAEFCPTRVDEFDMDGPGDIEKMNAMMVAQWNSQVAPDDVVYHLGDFAMGQIDSTLAIASRLNGRIRLILGNHDRPHPSYSKPGEKRDGWTQRYLDAGFEHLALSAALEIEGIPTIMNHFPYTGDSEGFDRYPEYRPADHGQVLVHGHVHDMWQIRGRQVNVGMDAHGGRLLHLDEVASFVHEAAGN